MSTAVAAAPAPPLAPPHSDRETSPKSVYPTLAPPSHNLPIDRRTPASATANATSANDPVVISEGVAQQKISPDGKRSPNS